MKNKNKVTILLTEDQIKAIEPLEEIAREAARKRKPGVIIGQTRLELGDAPEVRFVFLENDIAARVYWAISEVMYKEYVDKGYFAPIDFVAVEKQT